MRNIFKHRNVEIVGVYCDGERLFLAQLRHQKPPADIASIVENDEIVDVDYVFDVDNPVARWTLTDAVETPVEIPADVNGDDVKLRAEAIAEKVAVVCSTRGWSTSATAVCLTPNDVVTESDDLSKLPPNELIKAVQYQVGAAGAFELDNFHAAYCDVDGRTWMEGILKANAKVWLDAWRRNEMELTVLTAKPSNLNGADGIDLNGIKVSEGMISAIFAASRAALQRPPNFFEEEAKRLVGWDFRKLAAAVAAVTLIGLSGLFAFDHWNYTESMSELSTERVQLDDLERDGRLKGFIEREMVELDARKELLASLTRETFPWRSVLIHFGVIHVKGVWLNEIRSAEDKSIEIRGEAVSYEAMSEYISTLEADREFFRHEPEIQSSSVTRGGATVEFTVRLPML